MNLRARPGFLFVRLLSPEKVTAGGLHIPDTAQGTERRGESGWRALQPVYAEVVAVSGGAWQKPKDQPARQVRSCPDVKVGDTVVLAKKFVNWEFDAHAWALPGLDGPLWCIEEQYLDGVVTDA